MNDEAPQFPPRPTRLAWMILREAIREGDLAIDATAGNGHDTAFLAQCVGPGGKVIAFDIQPEAIESARSRVGAAGFAGRVVFHTLSHARMRGHVAAESAAVVMFNLGYLPGGDHALATSPEETSAALVAAASSLRPGGVLSVVCYPGHPGGNNEAEAAGALLTNWTADGWRVAKYAMSGTRRPAPFLLIAAKPASEAGNIP